MINKAKPVGINHVVLEVGDLDAALAFYGRIFDLHLRGRVPGQAFIDLGDQFLALAEVPGLQRGATPKRHFGLVVDDRSGVREAAAAAGAQPLPGDALDFVDPWGNRVEVVNYADVQFTKADAVLATQGVSPDKSDEARAQLRDKGIDATS